MKILLVVDVQKDFIDGALGSEAAQKVLPAIKDYVEKFRKYRENCDKIIFTQDTHCVYDSSKRIEMQRVPKHCIADTIGSAIMIPIAANDTVYQKDSFMMDFDDIEKFRSYLDACRGESEIEIIGYCTDICVISNALLLRKMFPYTPITIIENLCAGTSEEAHKAALTVAKSCLIDVRTEE